jgi:hypothetical protein
MSVFTEKDRDALIELYEKQIGKIPRRYIPSTLSKVDLERQLKNIKNTRTTEKGVERPKLKTAVVRRSKWTIMAETYFGKGNTSKEDMSRILGNTASRKLQLKKGFDEIYDKGARAYMTSGSRPNQTPQSWAMARIFSVLFGGKSRDIDKAIVDKYSIPLLG